MWEAPPLHVLVSSVNEPSNPIGMRMRATYYLRQAYTNATKELPSDSSSTLVHETKSDDSSDASPSRSQSHPSSSHQSTPSETISTIISTLGLQLQTPTHGSLMRHEFAYVMGQLREPRCCPYLEQTLDNTNDDVMVRHECAEALGAIADPASLVRLEYHANEDARVEISETCRIAVDFLRWTLGEGENGKGQEYDAPMACACMLSPYDSIDPAPPHPLHASMISETCRIAVDFLRWTLGEGTSGEGEGEEGRPEYDAPMACACMLSPYDSIDPAPPHPLHASIPTTQLGLNLRSPTHPLFERYRIMFSLRNRGSKDAVVELCETLVNDESSALLRHEIAYVLGQMQHPVSINYLAESLRREGEHVMVRHEAAEALGAIEGEWERCE
eukprot:CAMPEP_0194395540 /NCGR_PEP_ID=MMETSP0174-20130528/124480_1 /TAXON_ID=216777 /ORGANISM="Proboscia alata, Strain PI-D3" /LENGTH=386 /DNA_ID=CAMNT_0039191487 /DNA_START=95 /DNA_END=1252 /DNA_ORIENTATION=+